MLSEEKLTFKTPLEIAHRLETAAKNIKMLQWQHSCLSYSFGRGLQDECEDSGDVRCHNCGKTGHIHKVCCGCLKVVPLSQNTYKIKQLMTDKKEQGSEMKDEYNLFTLTSNH